MSGTDILFDARYRGALVLVAHATTDEVESLAGPVGPADGKPADDLMELWSLISIRFTSAIEIHALGWRTLLANTWISSPLVAVNLTEGSLRTRSGKIYLLGVRDQPELDPELRSHLAYALKTWGFDDAQPR
jgi:hypothetical protein